MLNKTSYAEMQSPTQTLACRSGLSDKFREQFLGGGLLSTVQDVQSIVSPSNDKDTIYIFI